MMIYRIKCFKYCTLIFILFFSCNSSKIIISQNGFDKFKIGETSLREIKSSFPDFKERKFVRHARYRTEEGRRDDFFYSNRIDVKNGKISFLFISRMPITDTIKVSSITFNKKSKAITDKGILVNRSTFKDILEKYGDAESINDNEGKHKFYPGIEFYLHN